MSVVWTRSLKDLTRQNNLDASHDKKQQDTRNAYTALALLALTLAAAILASRRCASSRRPEHRHAAAANDEEEAMPILAADDQDSAREPIRSRRS